MMSLKKWMICFFVAGFIATASAQEGLRSGNTVFKPYVSGAYAYTQKVPETSAQQSDSYWQSTVGANLSHATDVLEVGSGLWYSQRFSDGDAQKDSKSWGASGQMRVFTDKSSVGAQLRFREVEDFYSAPSGDSESSKFDGSSDRVFDRASVDQRRQTVNVGLDAVHRLSDNIGLSADYGFYQIDYEDNVAQGWHEHSIGSELSFRLTDKTFSYFDVGLDLQKGDESAQYGQVTTAHLGLKNRLTDKSTVRFGVGAAHYKSDTEEHTTASFAVNGNWQTTQNVSVFLRGGNSFQPMSNGQGAKMVLNTGGGIRVQIIDSLALTLSGGLAYDKQMEGAEAESFEKTGRISLDYTSKMGLGLFARAEYSDVDQDSGEDYDRFRGSIGIKYSL